MIKKVKTMPIVAAMLWGLTAQAQEMSPNTLNATGGSAEIAGNLYEYSIGEMVLVHTVSTPNLVVTQGLLQPSEETVGIGELTLSDKELSVYPNPSSDVVYIQPDLMKSGKLVITLMDMTGRQLSERTAELSLGNEKQSISLNSYAAGTYMLRVVFKQGQNNYVRNFKVQKIQ